MISLFLFLLGLILIWAIARWNKSVKLFIFLLIAYLGGIVGGSIIAHCSNNRKDTTSYSVIKKAIPTQSIICFCEATINVITNTNIISLSGAESLGSLNSIITQKQCSISSEPLNRGGPIIWHNTS